MVIIFYLVSYNNCVEFLVLIKYQDSAIAIAECILLKILLIVLMLNHDP